MTVGDWSPGRRFDGLVDCGAPLAPPLWSPAAAGMTVGVGFRIPAAGMTVGAPECRWGTGVRAAGLTVWWIGRLPLAPPLWIPAAAGMTVGDWSPAAAGMTVGAPECRWGTGVRAAGLTVWWIGRLPLAPPLWIPAAAGMTVGDWSPGRRNDGGGTGMSVGDWSPGRRFDGLVDWTTPPRPAPLDSGRRRNDGGGTGMTVGRSECRWGRGGRGWPPPTSIGRLCVLSSTVSV